MPSTSTDENPTFAYATPGDYDVTLQVTLVTGEVASITKTVTILEIIDTDYSYVADDCLGVTFTDETTGTYTITEWLWDFGDGTFSTDQNPVHTFPLAASYNVRLTAHSDHGGVSFHQEAVVALSDDTATAGFTSSIDVAEVTFTDTSGSSSSIVAWLWDFGDGIGTSTDQNPVYDYLSSDTYTVSLTVTSACGTQDTFMDDVTVTTGLVTDAPTLVFRKGAEQVAILTTDSHLITTSNFHSGSPPTWTDTDISGSLGGLTCISFQPDPFSDFYTGGGSQIDGYILQGSSGAHVKLYKVTDVFGAQTISLLYNSTLSTGRNASMQVSRFDANHVVIVCRKATGTTPVTDNVVAITTTDGSTFNENVVVTFSPPGTTGQFVNFCQIRPSDGYFVVASQVWSSGRVQHYYSSADGASWADDGASNNAGNSDHDQPFWITWDGNLLENNLTGGTDLFLNGSSVVFSDSTQGIVRTYGTVGSNGDSIASSPVTNSNLVLVGHAGSFVQSIWYSTDGGSTWTLIQHDTGAHTAMYGVVFADDDDETFWVWGDRWAAYSESLSATITNRATGTPIVVGIVTGST